MLELQRRAETMRRKRKEPPFGQTNLQSWCSTAMSEREIRNKLESFLVFLERAKKEKKKEGGNLQQ